MYIPLQTIHNSPQKQLSIGTTTPNEEIKAVIEAYQGLTQNIGPDIKVLSDLMTEGTLPPIWQHLDELHGYTPDPNQVKHIATTQATETFNDIIKKLSENNPLPSPSALTLLSKVQELKEHGKVAAAA